MTIEIQKAVEAGKLTKAQGAALEKLPPGGYVFHKSWGFGQVEGVDFLVNQLTINFKGKKAHAMQLPYAADSLQPIAPEHILAQKAADLDGVRARAKADPVAFLKGVLKDYNGKMTPDQVAQVLVPDVFPESEHKRWWDNAKKLLKKDGHFAIGTKKTEPIILREEAVSRVDEHLADFNNARQLKDQINALDRILKDLPDFADPVNQLQPIVYALEGAARRNAKLNTSAAIQLLLARDEIVERTGSLNKGAEAPTIVGLLKDEERQLRTLLPEIPAAKLKRVLLEMPAAFPDTWASKVIDFVVQGNARLVSDSARLLQEHGKTEELRSALDRAIRDHSISSAALTWLCDKKERKNEFAELIHPRVLSAIISSLERDQFLESRDRKLNDLLVNDRELITDLISDASPEELRETTRKLLLTPIFEELNKRSLLGRIVRMYPELEPLITGDNSSEKQEALIVSWESLDKRKADLEDLIKKRIPANREEIAIARSYGDLRENAEYKAAKETQRVLWRRQAEWERDISLARGTDFANADTTQVNIGTIVTLRDTNGQVESHTILGAWDSDPDKGIMSYQAAIAKALMGHKVGEQVQIPTEHGDRTAEITSIEPYAKSEAGAASQSGVLETASQA